MMLNTYDYNLIYYLTNPPPGSGAITATLASGVSQTWRMACTLKGVNVTNVLVAAGVSSHRHGASNRGADHRPGGRLWRYFSPDVRV